MTLVSFVLYHAAYSQMFVMNAISSETSLYRFDSLVDNLKPGAPRPDRQHSSVLRSFFHLSHSRGKKKEKKKRNDSVRTSSMTVLTRGCVNPTLTLRSSYSWPPVRPFRGCRWLCLQHALGLAGDKNKERWEETVGSRPRPLLAQTP